MQHCLKLLLIFSFVFLAQSCATHNAMMLSSEGAIQVSYEEQIYPYSCGSAALTGVINYWNDSLEVKEKDILEGMPPNDKELGYSLGELKRISRDYKLHSFVVSMTLDDLKMHLNKKRPIIVPLKIRLGDISNNFIDQIISAPTLVRLLSPEYNHYVIVNGYTENKLMVKASGDNQIMIEIDKFHKLWEANKFSALLITL